MRYQKSTTVKQAALILGFLLLQRLDAQCWKSIDAGLFFSAGIKTNGTLWTCGDNKYGQLGIGTLTLSTVPVQVGTANTWVALSTSMRDHVLALKQDGTLWSWGRNNLGQLGDGTNNDKSMPVQVGTDNDWKAIAAGGLFSIALKQNGTLWSWGANAAGSLGDGTNVSKNIPNQIGAASDWKQISAGLGHCLAIKTDGSIWSWGENISGALGIGNTANKNSPQKIGNATDWLFVEAGMATSFAIKQSGILFAWGNNYDGNLGTGNTSGELFPLQIGTSTWNYVSSAGHSLGIKTNGTLWGWGNKMATHYSNSPVQMSIDTDWTDVAAGQSHGLALKNDGSFWSWGANDSGQLGNATNNNINQPTNTNCITLALYEESSLSTSVKIFPNPSSSELNLDFINIKNVQQVQILNLVGEIVLSQIDEIRKINIHHLASGAYLVKIRTGENVYSKKFLKVSE